MSYFYVILSVIGWIAVVVLAAVMVTIYAVRRRRRRPGFEVIRPDEEQL